MCGHYLCPLLESKSMPGPVVLVTNYRLLIGKNSVPTPTTVLFRLLYHNQVILCWWYEASGEVDQEAPLRGDMVPLSDRLNWFQYNI